MLVIQLTNHSFSSNPDGKPKNQVTEMSSETTDLSNSQAVIGDDIVVYVDDNPSTEKLIDITDTFFTSNDHGEVENTSMLSCIYCDESYSNYRSMKAHLKNVHSIDYKCKKSNQKSNKLGKIKKTKKSSADRDADKLITKDGPLNDEKVTGNPKGVKTKRGPKENALCDICGMKFKCLVIRDMHFVEEHSLEKNLKCDKCDQAFYRQSCLDEHLARDSSECKPEECRCSPCSKNQKKTISCHLCDKKLRNQNTYKEHLAKKHLGDRPFKCLVCKKGFNTREILRKHSFIHTGYDNKCTSCDKVFFKRFNLKMHFLKNHFGMDDKDLSCRVCDRRFDDNKELKRHVWSEHLNGLRGKLEEVLPENVKKSIRSDPDHTNSNTPCKCHLCEKSFGNEFILKRHIMDHYNVRMFACHHCEQTFSSLSKIRTHLNYDHTGFRCYTCDRIKSDMRRPKTDEGPLVCNYCFKRFTTKMVLTSHFNRKHSKKDQPYECRDCHSNFKLKEELMSHIQNNLCLKPIQCEYCPRKFTQAVYKDHLQMHAQKSHASYRCDKCSKKFFNQTKFIKHQKYHDAPQTYSCSHCDKSFGSKLILNRHIKFHMEQKTQCKMCSKEIFGKSLLVKHMLDHFIDRPIDCEECRNKYCDFLVHFLGHFDEPKFHCLHCQDKFYLQTDLDYHILIHSEDVLSNSKEQIDEYRPNNVYMKQNLQDTQSEVSVHNITLDQMSESYEIQMVDLDGPSQVQFYE